MKRREMEDYLKQIANLSFEKIKWNKDNILKMRNLINMWEHNIKLPYGVYTADPACTEYYPAHKEMMKIINGRLKGSFKNKKIIDIGCADGYFSAECALQGAKVVGIDGRTLNIKKCEFVKSVLGIKNAKFIKDDAMNVTKSKYGQFDIVLALGILYHLDNPFKFLKNMYGLCKDFILIDTHVALIDQPKTLRKGRFKFKPQLSSLKEFKFGNKIYTGRLYPEYNPRTPDVEKEINFTSSLRNNWSIWLTEDSLINMLRDVGFEEISKIVYPKEEDVWWSDIRKECRVLILAVKKRQSWKSRIFTKD